jgi:PAS domain S-box-containing protein
MFELSPLALGIGSLILGVAVLILTAVSLGAVKRVKPDLSASVQIPLPIDLPAHDRAVILIDRGGRVMYSNHRANEWFDLQDEKVDLESMARETDPSEAFLNLCAQEGQTCFSLNGRLVQGISYLIPNYPDEGMVVSLQRLQFAGDPSGQERAATSEKAALGASSRAYLQVFTELSQAMASNLDLASTIETILENIERLVPADYAEVNIWNEKEGHLVPHRLFGLPGSERKVEKTGERYTSETGYSGYLISERVPLYIPSRDDPQKARPQTNLQKYPLQSYAGFPLLIAGDLIGTLELGSTSPRAFTQDDLDLLKLIAGQAAGALHNALIYQEEQRRAKELAGLAQLAQASCALPEEQDLYPRLVEALDPLVDVEILGFLIFDESRWLLKARAPFLGLPPEFVDLYQVPILPDSATEAIWAAQEVIVAPNAPEDLKLQALGLEHHAVASGMRETVLVPLNASERNLGYLLVANKRDGAPFHQEDMRLLAIVAGHSALIIENATLFRRSERRAQRAESLRRIASLASSIATKDEILKWSLQELARLVGADAAAIFLLEESSGDLRLHTESLLGVSQQTARQLSRLSVHEAQFHLTVTGSQQTFITRDAGQDERILPFYKPLIEQLEIKSAIDVPLVVRNHGIGEMMFGSHAADFFGHSDVQTLATAAGQLAGAIERSNLATQTDENLKQRVKQLTALTRISRELNASSDLDYLLKRVYAEAIKATSADCGMILLFNQPASNGHAPKIILQVGDDLAIPSHSLESMVAETDNAIIIQDFEQADRSRYPMDTEDIFPLQPPHPSVRSALLVPILYQERTAGLIQLHATEPGRFDSGSIDIAQALSAQAASALGSALRYQEQIQKSTLLNRRVETLEGLLKATRSLRAGLPLDHSLRMMAQSIQETTPFQKVLISVYDAQHDRLQRVAAAGLSLADTTALFSKSPLWDGVRELLKDDFNIAGAYFIPHEKMPVVPPDVHVYVPMPLEDKHTDGGTWHPEDILLLPMFDPSGGPLGLISVDDPRDGLRPDRATIDALQLFARQISLIIESCQKSDVLELAGHTSPVFIEGKQFAPAAEGELIPSDATPDHKYLFGETGQAITRMRACLKIAERINRYAERSEVLSSLAKQLFTQMDMEFVLVAEADPGGIQLTCCLGPVPPNVNPGVLLGQRNPLQHSLLHNEMVLVPDVRESLFWQTAPLIQALQARSIICLPVSSNHRPEVAVLGISQSPQLPFSTADEQAFDLLARQAGIALQNAGSLAETKRRLQEVNHLLSFSRQVSSLDPGSILQALVDSARLIVPEADAAAIVMWDAEMEGLVPKAASGYADTQRLNEITYPVDKSLPGMALKNNSPLRIDEVDFSGQYHLPPESLMRYRDATAGRLPVSSLLVPITSSESTQRDDDSAPTQGVLILDSYKTAAAFTPDDQSMISSLTYQAALTLENLRLYQASEQRAGQIQAMTGIAAMFASSLQSDELIGSLLEQMYRVIRFDTGTLWLREAGHLRVRSAHGFEDSEERVGLAVALDDSRLFAEMVSTGQPIYVNDIREDPRFPALFDYPRLSWLGIPLVAKGEMIGVIALEKNEANFYTQQDVQLVSAFASQAAIALENANLYKESLRRAQELDRRSQRLGLLNRLSTALSTALEQEEIFAITMEELSGAVNAATISVVTFEYPGDAIAAEEDRQISLCPVLVAEQSQKGEAELPCSLPQTPLFDRLRQSLGVFSTESVQQEEELAPLKDFFSIRETQSLLVMPMSVGTELHSLLLIQKDQPYHYSAEEFELIRTISNQAGIAAENARLFQETRRLTEELEQRVEERTNQLAQEHHRIATLLRIITELSASLDLEQVLTRTLKVLNEAVAAEQIFCLIWRPGKAELRQAASVFSDIAHPKGPGPLPFNSNRGFAGEVISSREPHLIRDVMEDPAWGEYQDIESSQRSAAGVPLMVGEELLGALLLFHSQPGHFSPDQLDLIQATGNQIAVTVNNAELYNLIRDQAEDLGNMLRSQQIETSRSRAILESVAEGVLVTDAENRITLFNASAEKILGLDRQQILGRSLEHFTGLFGGAARSWMATIREWSGDLLGYNPGQTYAEKINLEDGRVVSIQLAPVLIRDEFLGTVSIFHDISHQVEVDRLKTEFVATVSHELRTPMTSIKGYVDLLLMGATGDLSEQQRHFLEIVQENTQRLAILVNDLLDISRIEANRVKLVLQPLDLRQLAEDGIGDLVERSEKADKRLELNLEVSSDLPRVTGDPDRVRQILAGLLDNAYHYTPQSGRITLRARQLGDEVQVDVQDSGIGIPVEEQEHVFERFYRGENPLVLEISGTGLGLSIVRHLVEMHAGRIWLQSAGIPGEGTTFSFTLPVYRPKE